MLKLAVLQLIILTKAPAQFFLITTNWFQLATTTIID